MIDEGKDYVDRVGEQEPLRLYAIQVQPIYTQMNV